MIETHGYQARPVHFFLSLFHYLLESSYYSQEIKIPQCESPWSGVWEWGPYIHASFEEPVDKGTLTLMMMSGKYVALLWTWLGLTSLSPRMSFWGSLSWLENWGSINKQIVQVHRSHTDTIHKKDYTAVDPCYSVEHKMSVSISVKTSSLRASQMQGERIILTVH